MTARRPGPKAKPARKSEAEARRITRLCEWFAAHARDLPWRRNRTGYTALVAEAMLQQTQVSRVIEVFNRFMRRFPDVRSLARADEQEVLAHWQGMGYYRRAENLHAAARMIVDEFDGNVPRDVESLLRLPGVGRYTAGAIASIVHGAAAPIVDGNVERVLARWHAKHAAGEQDSKRWTWRKAEELAAAAPRPGVFNEALMELGALVCTPASPRCGSCPVAGDCLARKRGLQNEIPAPRRRPERAARVHHAVVISAGGKVLLEQRPRGGMWGGMWQPPTIEADEVLSIQALQAMMEMKPIGLARIDGFTHHTTHRVVRFEVYAARIRGRTGHWRALDELDDVPMGNPQRRALKAAGVELKAAKPKRKLAALKPTRA